MVTRQGQRFGLLAIVSPLTLCNVGEQQPFIRNVFTFDTCANIVGSHVLEFTDESKLLLAWRDFVEEVDPDVVIGYNIASFDFPYLMDRAKALKLSEFPYLGRLKSECPTSRVRAMIESCQISERRPKARIFRQEHMDNVTRRKPPLKADCNLIFCNSCNASTNCAVTASTLSALNSWENKRKTSIIPSLLNCRRVHQNQGED